MSSSIPTNSPPVVTFEEVQAIAKDPKAIGIIIDVRQPEEISSTGLIPSSHNIPRQVNACAPLIDLKVVGELSTAFNLSEEQFKRTYSFPKPDHQTPIIFSCKLGQRADTAAKLAAQMGFQAKCYKGSWLDWSFKSK